MADYPPTEATLRRRTLLGPDAVRAAHEQAAAAPAPSPDVRASLEVLLSSARYEIRLRQERENRGD